MRYGHYAVPDSYKSDGACRFIGYRGICDPGNKQGYRRNHDCGNSRRPSACFRLDIQQSIETITAYIVQVSLGDVQHGSLEYKTIYAAGITLFIFTFLLNNISYFIKNKYQEKYE